MIVDFKRNSIIDSEFMGIFGLSWEEKIASFIKKRLKGTGFENKLSDFFQAGGLNIKLVTNIHNEYMALMASGYNPSNFVSMPDNNGNGGNFSESTKNLSSLLHKKTNIESVIIDEFLRSLFVLSRDGKIPFEKWNPQGFKESTELRKTFETEKNFLDNLTVVAKKSNALLWIAGIGVTALLLNQLKFLPIKK